MTLYVGTLNALASCMVGLVGPIKTSRPYCVHTYPYLFFQDRIKEMEKEFDLVLFSEMFDESMVLLADKLCWPLDYGSHFVFHIFSHSSQIFFSHERNHHLTPSILQLEKHFGLRNILAPMILWPDAYFGPEIFRP